MSLVRRRASGLLKLQSHYNSTLDTPRMIAGQAINPKTSRAGGRGERQERARGHPPPAHEPNGEQEKIAIETQGLVRSTPIHPDLILAI